MAYISRKDCAKAVAYALHRSGEFTQKVWDINGPGADDDYSVY